MDFGTATLLTGLKHFQAIGCAPVYWHTRATDPLW